MRRYRCTQCKKAILVGPRDIAPYYRYSLGAIALAITLWSVLSHSASATRKECSPSKKVGGCEEHRWQSLTRWTLWGADLFRLNLPAIGDRPWVQAETIARLLMARGPADGSTLEQAFAGAYAW